MEGGINMSSNNITWEGIMCFFIGVVIGYILMVIIKLIVNKIAGKEIL